jgi:hypothetical protein
MVRPPVYVGAPPVVVQLESGGGGGGGAAAAAAASQQDLEAQAELLPQHLEQAERQAGHSEKVR